MRRYWDMQRMAGGQTELSKGGEKSRLKCEKQREKKMHGVSRRKIVESGHRQPKRLQETDWVTPRQKKMFSDTDTDS